MFGSSANANNGSWQNSGGFGSINNTKPTLNLNLNNNNNASGTNSNTTNTIGANSLFGNTTAGNNNPSNTNNSATTGGLFGNSTTTTGNSTNTGGLFGNSASNTSSTGGLFGNSNPSTTASTGGLFGNSASNTTSTGGLFGNSGNKPGLFTSNNNTSTYNNSNNNLFSNNQNNNNSILQPSQTTEPYGTNAIFKGITSNFEMPASITGGLFSNDAKDVKGNKSRPSNNTTTNSSTKNSQSVLSRLARSFNIFRSHSNESDTNNGIFSSNDYPTNKSLISSHHKKNKITKPLSFSSVEARSSNEIKKLIIKSKPLKYHLINADKVLKSKQWRVIPEIISSDRLLTDEIEQPEDDSDAEITNVSFDTNKEKKKQQQHSKIIKGSSDILSNPITTSSTKISINSQNGYWTSPSLTTLASWSLSDLSSIEYFIVGRKGFGQIAFNLPIDLSDIKSKCDEEGKELYDVLFDEIIEIGPKYVKVYKDNENKPERGYGLNVPATITLEKIEPTEGNELSSFIKMLKSKSGMEFVTYDPITFTWTFKVQHFSIWGLVDESKDSKIDTIAHSDNSTMDEDVDSYLRELKKQKLNHQTKDLPGNWSVDANAVLNLKKKIVNNEINSELQGFNKINKNNSLLNATYTESEVDKDATSPIRENYEYLKQLISVLPTNIDLTQVVEERAYEPEIEDTGAFNLIKPKPNLAISDDWLVQLKLSNDLNSSLAQYLTSNEKYSKILKDGKLQLQSIDDILFHDFNASADSNSKEISTPSSKSSNSNNSIDKDEMEIDDAFEGDKFEQIKIYSTILPKLLDSSNFVKRSNNFFKVLETNIKFDQLINDPTNEGENNLLPKSILDILLLCSTLFDDNIKISNENKKVESHLNILEQRKSFTNWLMLYNSKILKDLIDNASDNFDKIFIYICAGEIKQAIKTAIESNNHHLAAILTSIDSNYQGIKQVAKSQLEEWENNNFIPINLIKIYKFISGEHHDEILKSLPWSIVLACDVYYSDAQVELYKTINHSVANIEADSLEDQNIINILKFYPIFKSSSVEDSLTFINSSSLKIGIKWLILKLIKLPIDDKLNSLMGKFIEKLGLWKESIFIYSHVSIDKQSEKLIRKVIQSNIKKIKNDNLKIDEEPFLTDILKIPSSLIYESVATDMDINKDYWKACEAFIIAKSWNQAHEVIVNKLGPSTIISSKSKDINKLLELISQFPNKGDIIPTWSQGAGIFQKYFKLLPFIRKPDLINNTLINNITIDVEALLDKLPLLTLDNSVISKAMINILLKNIGDLAITIKIPQFKSKIMSLPLGENEMTYFKARLA